MESLTFEQLVKGHFKQKKDWIPSNDMESKIWKILNSDSTDEPSEAKSLKPIPEPFEPTEYKSKVDKPASQSDKSFEVKSVVPGPLSSIESESKVDKSTSKSDIVSLEAKSVKPVVRKSLEPTKSDQKNWEVVDPTSSTDDTNYFVNPICLRVVNDYYLVH